VREPRTLRFVHEASNVILLGPPGVGKLIWRRRRFTPVGRITS
jgi:hypothetical protein